MLMDKSIMISHNRRACAAFLNTEKRIVMFPQGRREKASFVLSAWQKRKVFFPSLVILIRWTGLDGEGRCFVKSVGFEHRAAR